MIENGGMPTLYCIPSDHVIGWACTVREYLTWLYLHADQQAVLTIDRALEPHGFVYFSVFHPGFCLQPIRSGHPDA